MKVVTIGKRLIPIEQVAFVEPFDPSANPDFRPEKDFKARIVLLNRDAVLTEQTPSAFAKDHELHLFAEDNVAVNHTIVFKVEMFEPTDSFKPAKAYKTRLRWSDTSGADQSKLLVTSPETVITELTGAKVLPAVQRKRTARRPSRRSKAARQVEASNI